MSRLPDRQAVFVGVTALPVDWVTKQPDRSMPRRAPPPSGSSLGAWASGAWSFHGTVLWRRR